METVHHFTEENSPLLSNSIESIAIHPRTGEVFIGTGKGLVSYQSDATEAENSFKESNVRAYPNPVRPDYDGVITVTGMVYDGQFTWNGRNKQGKRVSTGIYMVLAADSEGKEGVVTKIAFVR